ncbi:MAG: aldo/keto reductase, partial [Bacteroidota bacterium]
IMTRKITRRKFVQTTATAAAAVTIVPAAGCAGSPYDPKGLPTVKLGSTGARVPVMGFGCGSRWMSVQDDDKALQILEYALDQGLYYWDTAASYGNDQISSEERVGKILLNHRSKVFMVSKTGDRGAEEAKKSVERSLERLQTDHLDLMHIHAITSVEDAEQLGEKGKVLEVLQQYKSEGVIKHIGFTGHASAEGMKRAAELYDFDVMMMALNHQSTDGSQKFEELPAPFAMKKGMGVVAMKVIRPRETVDGLDAGDLMKYALSLDDFHMINVGIDSMDVLQANLEIIRNFKALDPQKMDELRLALQPFYRGRSVAWMEPSYVDGWNQGIKLA